MVKRYGIVLMLILAVIIFISIGCNSVNNHNKVAYISANDNSEYENTFKELNLGFLLDYNFKLLNADNSWVSIWLEAYSNGKPIEPFHLMELSYGLSPKQVEEGPIGFGIIDSNNKEKLLFLYSPYGKVGPHSIESDLFVESGINMWDCAIGSGKIGLEFGQELILGVYRQAEESLRTYDYQNLDSINQMINEDTTVILLKIKVDEKSEL